MLPISTNRLISAAFILAVGVLPAGAQEVDFAHDVLPILQKNCAKCHTDGKYKGKFSMDTREAILKSENIVLGKSAESELVQRVLTADPDERMPPKGARLTGGEVAVLEKWIDGGLAWESGFTFRKDSWESPVRPRKVALPQGDAAPVDRIVAAYLQEKKVTPPAPLADVAFVRRVHLDLVGLLPTPEETRAFLSDQSPGKRGQLVDALLARDEDYAAHWMTFWNDLLRNDYAGTGFIDGGRKQITEWLFAALLSNKPYDVFARELIDADGTTEGFIKGIKWRGNVNASQVQEVQFAQNISQVFLGENMKCASCHDSFINDWKLADAYGLAAIIADRPLELHRCDKPTGEIAKAKWLFPELGDIDPSAGKQERLKQAAALMTSSDNGRFARTIVNRIWQRLMGRGLVEPVDIMGNRPWSEDLLDYLAWDFAENGYDIKRLLATMVNSRSYQSVCVEPFDGPAGDYVFRGPVSKRMTAEQFVDAVWELTNSGPQKPDANVPVPAPPAPGSADSPARLSGSFIWTSADRGAHQAGEKATFQKIFELDAVPQTALAVITCDNSYVLEVNGRKIGADPNWEAAESYDVAAALRAGENTIRVEAANGGAGPNPAGLFCALKLIAADGQTSIVATGEDWQFQDGTAWKPAATLGGPAQWGAPLAAQMESVLNGDPSGPRPAVRASLVQASMLMRALGRPNREQVVTTRPAELSTLQALELNNGKEFVALLENGARALDASEPEPFVRSLFERLLCRPPDAGELAAGVSVLKAGAADPAQGEADLLWVLLMLPEFQIIQ